ncbi:MAG TPA: hypothetical protein VL978_00945 [Puia sp.]|nr:hypothetical protein [Puia sp.]
MAENEIVKHVEAAYKALQKPHASWLHRLKEVLIEIAIIVFAVTLSIWFHNWSDSLHEHHEEKQFLTGLKKDIHADLEAARGDSAFYATQLYRLRYFQRVAVGQPLNPDSMVSYQGVFFSNATLEPHISRYEGLKGSGKLGIIENPDLLNNIINLHEEAIKHVETLDGYYTDYAYRLGNYFEEHAILSPDSKTIPNVLDVLHSNQMRFLMLYGTSFITLNVLKAHDTCIARCQRLISQIDSELDLPDSTAD